MTFIPHGLDSTFVNPALGIVPPSNAVLVRALLGTEAGKQRYRERLGNLFTNVFRLESISNYLNEGVMKLCTLVQDPKEKDSIRKHASDLHKRILERHRSIAEQLAVPEAPELRFNDGNRATLSGWKAKADFGDPQMARLYVNGKPIMYIRAHSPDTLASWRTRFSLRRGQYSFRGNFRTARVKSSSLGKRAEASLRTSGSPAQFSLSEDSEWMVACHEFEIKDEQIEVEFICDLRADSGEVWFEQDSLEIRRRANE